MQKISINLNMEAIDLSLAHARRLDKGNFKGVKKNKK